MEIINNRQIVDFLQQILTQASLLKKIYVKGTYVVNENVSFSKNIRWVYLKTIVWKVFTANT